MVNDSLKKRWVLKEADDEIVENLSNELRLNSVICRLLVQRNVKTPSEVRAFFRPKYEHLHDPYLMKDMDKAIDRIEQAIIRKERIVVYGDYDVDGTSAVALVYSFLKEYYFYVDYFIPDRQKEGYGVSRMGIDACIEKGANIIISLDCGIKAIDEVAYAAEKGVDFIICDHHRPDDLIPAAVAVLDPYRKDCKYPYKELSACGIGFKLIQAFAQYNSIPFNKVKDQLDLVAISIAADIVPITGENRVLAYFGMQKLNRRPRAGIKSLIQKSGLNRELSISDIVFVIGPIINAAGRMDNAERAVKLLSSRERIYANDDATILREHNFARRLIDYDVTEEALQLVEEDPLLLQRKATVVYKPDWHKGVIGIVASRLIEKFYRPTIVLTSSDGVAAGSARSVPGFDIYNAIKECEDLLEQFGGHRYAAGLTMHEKNVPAFMDRIEKIVARTIEEKQLQPEMLIDAEVDLYTLNHYFNKYLERFAPFGPGNQKPLFITRNLHDTGYSTKVGSDRHIKFNVKQGRSFPMKGIGFNMGDRFDEVSGKKFDLCFTLEKNVWNDHTYLQMNVKDIQNTEDWVKEEPPRQDEE